MDRMTGAPFVHDMIERNAFGAPVHPGNMYSKLKFRYTALSNRPGVIKVVQDGSFVGVLAASQQSALEAAEWARGKAQWREIDTTVDNPMSYLNSQHHDFEVIAETGDVNKNSGQWCDFTILSLIFSGSLVLSCSRKMGERKAYCLDPQPRLFQLRGALPKFLKLKKRI